jgi:hypothetical protein
VKSEGVFLKKTRHLLFFKNNLLQCPVGICQVSQKKIKIKIELMVLKKSNNRGSQENQQTSQRTCPLLQ